MKTANSIKMNMKNGFVKFVVTKFLWPKVLGALAISVLLPGCFLERFTTPDLDAQFSSRYGGISAKNCGRCVKDLNKKMLSTNRGVPHRASGPSIYSSKRAREISQLQRQLIDEQASVRTRAVTSASFLGSSGMLFVDEIEELAVKDPSKWVRRASIKALERMTGRGSLPIIKRAARDQDKWVRHSAQNILARIDR